MKYKILSILFFGCLALNANIQDEVLPFNCGHEAIALYDELVHQEVDSGAALDAAMEYYNRCTGG